VTIKPKAYQFSCIITGCIITEASKPLWPYSSLSRNLTALSLDKFCVTLYRIYAQLKSVLIQGHIDFYDGQVSIVKYFVLHMQVIL
jgi:hypothetical protein